LPSLIDTEAAAAALGLHPRTIRKLAAKGTLTNRGEPRRMAFDLDELTDLAETRQQQRLAETRQGR
jgi:hypothetical protein